MRTKEEIINKLQPEKESLSLTQIDRILFWILETDNLRDQIIKEMRNKLKEKDYVKIGNINADLGYTQALIDLEELLNQIL